MTCYLMLLLFITDPTAQNQANSFAINQPGKDPNPSAKEEVICKRYTHGKFKNSTTKV